MRKKPELDNITLPVYEVCHKELEDKAKDIEDVIIPGAIAADKDILSQIMYEEDKIIFPSGILPLSMTFDDEEFYFDYVNLQVVYADNSTYANLNIEDNNIVSISLSDYEADVENLEFCHFNGSIRTGFNSYNLYHPVTSAGTKLYVHELDLLDGDEETLSVKIISDNSSAYTSFAQLLADLRNEKAFVMNSQKVTYLSNDFYPTAIFADESSALITICCVKMSDLENTSLAVEDVDADNVIEL